MASPRIHVPPPAAGALAVVLAATGACTKPSSPPGERAETTGHPDAPSLPPAPDRHRAAFAAARPRVEEVLLLGDPVAGHLYGKTPLGPPPVAADTSAPILDARDAAFRELAGIEADLLPPADRVLLEVARFGLSALSDRLRHGRPTRRFPDWYVVEARRALDATWELALSGGDGVDSALENLAHEVEGAYDDLGAASIPAARAAVADLRDLAAEVRDLGRRVPGSHLAAAKEAAAALERVADRLDRVVPSPKDAPRPASIRRVAAGGGEGPLVRLQDAWGATVLRDMLATYEAVSMRPRVLLGLLEKTHAHLSALTVSQETGAPVSPVTPDRCAAVVAELTPKVQRFPQLAEAEADCTHLLPRLPARLSDPALAYLVVRDGFVQTAARRRQRTQVPLVGAVTGRAAPFSQALAQSIAVLMSIGRKDAAALAVADAREAVCLAMAAVYLHAELGDVAALEAALDGTCPDPKDLVRRALARPWAALRGIALTAVVVGPARLAALDGFPWLPYGLLAKVAEPPAPPSPPPPARIEAPAAPDASASTTTP